LETIIENRMNCWNSKSNKSTRQSAAKPQTLLWKVQRLMGLTSVLCNTILASDTVTIWNGDDIVQATEKSVDSMQLHASGAPMPFNLVLSPKQIWGGKGIQNLLVHTNSGSQVADNPLSQEMLSSGMVGQLAGNAVYWSGEINENVASAGDAAGAMFSRGALGIGFSSAGPVKVAQQRDESARLTEFIGIMVAGVIEVKDTFGVYILTDVS